MSERENDALVGLPAELLVSEVQSRRQMEVPYLHVWDGGAETHYCDEEAILSRIRPRDIKSGLVASAVGVIATQPADQPLTRDMLAEAVPLKAQTTYAIVRRLLMSGIIIEGPSPVAWKAGEYPAAIMKTEDFDVALSRILPWRRAVQIRQLMLSGLSEEQASSHPSLPDALEA